MDPELMTASASRLTELVPDLGLFSAEDIVAWRDEHGSFPDLTTLCDTIGLEKTVAERLALPAATSPATSGTPEPPTESSGPEEEPPPPTDAGPAPVPVDATCSAEPPDSPVVTPPLPANVEPPIHPGPTLEATSDGASEPPIDTTSVAQIALAQPAVALAVEAPIAAPETTPAAVDTGAATPKAGLPRPALLAVIFATLVGLGAGLFQTRREQQHAIAPIASMSSEVKTLAAGQAGLRDELSQARAELAETKAKVDETNAKIDEHSAAIEATAKTLKKVAEEQKAADHDRAALGERVAKVEKATNDNTVPLSEALKMIDAAEQRVKARAIAP
jgi:hypothetical protein